MRRGGARAGVAGAVLAAILVAPGVLGQPPGSIPPVYTQRLQVPVRGDDLDQPRAVVADLHSGEILVCDTTANRIVIFDPQGRFRYEIRGGATFQSPIDLAVDPEGYLFVVSQASSQVTLLDFDGRLLHRLSLAGLPDEAVAPRFSSLAISPAGDRLYLMDFENDRLWITDRQGAIVASVDTTVGRTPKEIEELRYGKVDVYGETVLLPIPNDGLVHLYDLEGRTRGTIGDPGSAECQLMFPAAAALDEEGKVLILDQQRAMFMTWDLDRGACVSEHYGFGNAPGAFYQPSDMTLDASGRLYVSQGFEGRVQVYEGARPAPVLMAARPQEAPEISEETLIADAGAGAATETSVAVREPLVPRDEAAATPPVPEAAEPPAEPAPTQIREPIVPAPTPIREPVVPAPTAPAAEAPPPTPLEPPAAEPASAAAAAPARLASRLVAGARLSIERAPRYDPTYVEIAYPGGDPPLDQGGAVDLVVRAFRHAGIDLQKALQEDRRAEPAAYPINEPDPSIDHRRIRNLAPLFDRLAESLPPGREADWTAGDVVLWDRNADGIAGHVGIVTDETGPSGHLLVAHHHRVSEEFAGIPSIDDVLFRWPVAGHYRWPAATAAAAEPVTAEVTTGVEAEVERAVRAWARAWAGKKIEEYLSFYSDAFDTGRELDRPGWERLRRARLERPRTIEVTLAQMEPRLTAEDRAQVSFVQTYRSDLYADKVDKILTLRREADGWKILAERVVRTYRE